MDKVETFPTSTVEMEKISSTVTSHSTIKLEADENWRFSPTADWPKREVDKASRFS